MIIEMTGLPGAGKTTCQGYISHELRKRKYNIIMRPEIDKLYVQNRFCSSYSSNYWFRHPYTLMYRANISWTHFKELMAIRRPFTVFSKPRSLPCYWLSEDILLADYYLNRFESSSNNKTIYLSSEGLIHHSAAIIVWCGRSYSALSNRWFECNPSNDILVIHLRVPIEMALSRLWNRGIPDSWPRDTKLNKSSAKDALLRFEEAIEDTLLKFRIAGSQIFSLDVSCDLNLIESKIINLLDSLPLK